MSLAASKPALIGIDWGTSSLRAFLISQNGEVLESLSKPLGILQVPDKNFEKIFIELVSSWLENARLPVIASGMITSRNGWIETPYVATPSGVQELADSLVSHKLSDDLKVTFVTGMVTEKNGVPDVMRGEETQIIGASMLGASDGRFVLPGTHSKWITVQNNLIKDFATYMTGEVFAVLRHNSILGALIEESNFNETAFRQGCSVGLDSNGELLHDLFSARTLPLFEKISSDAVEDYLSGILIGAELKGVQSENMSSPITIVGRSDLSDRYGIGLDVAGFKSIRAPEDVVAMGHFYIAQAAGII